MRPLFMETFIKLLFFFVKSTKERNLAQGCKFHSFYISPIIISIFYCTWCIDKYTSKIVYIIITHTFIHSSLCAFNFMCSSFRPNCTEFIRTVWKFEQTCVTVSPHHSLFLHYSEHRDTCYLYPLLWIYLLIIFYFTLFSSCLLIQINLLVTDFFFKF